MNAAPQEHICASHMEASLDFCGFSEENVSEGSVRTDLSGPLFFVADFILDLAG